MLKLDKKQIHAADLADQLRALPSDAMRNILDQGYFVCELKWRDEKRLDSGNLDLSVAENVDLDTCRFSGKLKGLNLHKTRPLEKALADLIEKAWLHCVVHNRCTRTGDFPNRIALKFSSHRGR